MISDLLIKLRDKGVFKSQPELLDILFQLIDLGMQQQRPASETILDDVDLRKLLNVSQRTIATWRQKRLIKHTKLEGKMFYRLSDVLELLEEHSIKPMKKVCRIKL